MTIAKCDASVEASLERNGRKLVLKSCGNVRLLANDRIQVGSLSVCVKSMLIAVRRAS